MGVMIPHPDKSGVDGQISKFREAQAELNDALRVVQEQIDF